MISTGGLHHVHSDWAGSNPWQQDLGVFEMTTLLWRDHYDADAPDYTSPDVVKKWYVDG